MSSLDTLIQEKSASFSDLSESAACFIWTETELSSGVLVCLYIYVDIYNAIYLPRDEDRPLSHCFASLLIIDGQVDRVK